MNDEKTTIGINGLAHVILTMSDFEKAREYYSKLLPCLLYTSDAADE